MNYIELIRTFWRLHEEHSFSTAEIALYLYLAEVSNICRWKNPFRRNNAKIQADLNISYNILKNARNKLQQTGLISYRTRNGSPNVTYTLTQPESGYTKANSEAANELKAEDTIQPAPAKYKPNKTQTKLNNEIAYPFEEIAELWNNLCPLQPKIKKMTRGREEKIRKRLTELGEPALWIPTIRTIFEKVNESLFMQGENKNGWRATFDWVFENDKNIIKILEGNYDNRSIHTETNRANGHSARADERKRELDHLEDLCAAVLQCDIPPQH